LPFTQSAIGNDDWQIGNELTRGSVVNRIAGLYVLIGGICLIVLGLLIYSGGLNWFGNLPGDIRYEGENSRVYVPIVSMLLVSIVLTLIFNLIRRLF
jgi:hypothetical protein